jgi:hypothetical protein
LLYRRHGSVSLEDASNLHLHSGLGQVSQSVAALELGILDDTSIGVAGEVASPFDEGAVLKLARGDGVAADGADDAGVRELRLGSDDAVGDVVVDGAVLLLLDLELGAVVEGPLDQVGLLLRLDDLALLEGRPEGAEVLELDVVPDVAERGLDNGALDDGGGSGNDGRHCDDWPGLASFQRDVFGECVDELLVVWRGNGSTEMDDPKYRIFVVGGLMDGAIRCVVLFVCLGGLFV